MEKIVTLSERLKCLTDMVSQGNRVVDVGCDHGFLSIYLVQKGISPSVLAMDVRPGPLARAKEHIAQYGLDQYIQTRISDGLLAFQIGEADTMVCAGMGGKLMTKILTDSEEKAKQLKELILQPQSELPVFRRFLREEGYEIVEENILCEDGKYYFPMKVIYTGEKKVCENSLFDEFGGFLLTGKHPVLEDYLNERKDATIQIIASLRANENERAQKRLEEMELELAMIEQALGYYQ